MKQPSLIKSAAELKGAKIAILQTKWHREHTDRMVEKCQQLLRDAGATEAERHMIPGALELPIAAQSLARTGKYAALICFGAIIKGDTDHYEMVRDNSAQGLMRVSIDESIPIINEVLACLNVEQLKARSADDEFNKGIEAAKAAIDMIFWKSGH